MRRLGTTYVLGMADNLVSPTVEGTARERRNQRVSSIKHEVCGMHPVPAHGWDPLSRLAITSSP